MSAHSPPTHAAVPFVSVGQVRQAAPQPVGSLSAAHRAPVPVPHRWVPAAQVKSHVVPSHVVALAPVGFGHELHDVAPQLSTLVFDAQIPLQLCVPAGHVPQAAVMATHAPAHSCMLAGQAGMHAVPSQVTEPPVGF